jgi:hypothetical protein
MREVNSVSARRAVAALALGAALTACSRSENKTTDSAAGNVAAAAGTVDTGLTNAATPVAGGTAQITPMDAKSVEHATEYKLTEDNFRRFIAASDSLMALRRRDSQVNAMFEKQVSDAGVATRTDEPNAGRKRLEDNPRINNAIVSAGMSAKDYFVASIAIAQAERFMGDPKSAPPTPTLPANAEFLRRHQTGLAKIHQLEQTSGTSAPPVTATPSSAPAPASTKTTP